MAIEVKQFKIIYPDFKTWENTVLVNVKKLHSGKIFIDDSETYYSQEAIYNALNMEYSEYFSNFPNEILHNKLGLALSELLPELHAKTIRLGWVNKLTFENITSNETKTNEDATTDDISQTDPAFGATPTDKAIGKTTAKSESSFTDIGSGFATAGNFDFTGELMAFVKSRLITKLFNLNNIDFDKIYKIVGPRGQHGEGKIFTFNVGNDTYEKSSIYFYNNELKFALSNGTNGISKWDDTNIFHTLNGAPGKDGRDGRDGVGLFKDGATSTTDIDIRWVNDVVEHHQDQEYKANAWIDGLQPTNDDNIITNVQTVKKLIADNPSSDSFTKSEYFTSNSELLTKNDDSLVDTVAMLGNNFFGKQYYGLSALGAQYYGASSRGGQYYGWGASGDFEIGRTTYGSIPKLFGGNGTGKKNFTTFQEIVESSHNYPDLINSLKLHTAKFNYIHDSLGIVYDPKSKPHSGVAELGVQIYPAFGPYSMLRLAIQELIKQKQKDYFIKIDDISKSVFAKSLFTKNDGGDIWSYKAADQSQIEFLFKSDNLVDWRLYLKTWINLSKTYYTTYNSTSDNFGDDWVEITKDSDKAAIWNIQNQYHPYFLNSKKTKISEFDGSVSTVHEYIKHEIEYHNSAGLFRENAEVLVVSSKGSGGIARLGSNANVWTPAIGLHNQELNTSINNNIVWDSLNKRATLKPGIYSLYFKHNFYSIATGGLWLARIVLSGDEEIDYNFQVGGMDIQDGIYEPVQTGNFKRIISGNLKVNNTITINFEIFYPQTSNRSSGIAHGQPEADKIRQNELKIIKLDSGEEIDNAS